MDCSLPGFSVHGIFRQEYWSGLPFSSPGDLPDPGIKSRSPALQADFFLLSEPLSENESHSVMSDSVQPHGLYSPYGCKESHTTERLSLTVYMNQCYLESY